MHFAHGWPRWLDTQARGAPITLAVSGGCVALVTAHALELWSAGRNRVRLAQLDCGVDVEGGPHIAAAWSGSRRRLAVLTSAGLLRIYAVHVNDEAALPPSAIPSEAALLVDDPASAAAAAAAAAAGAPPPGSGPASAAGMKACTLWLADEVDLGGAVPTRLDPDRHAGSSAGPGKEEGGGAGPASSPDRAPASDPAAALGRALSWPRARAPVALASDGGSRLLVGFADGELVSLTWSGSAKSRARPFDAPGAFPGVTAAAAPAPPLLRTASSLADAGQAVTTPRSSGALDGPGAGAAAFARHLAARLVEEQADDAAAAEAVGVATVATLPPLPRRPSPSTSGLPPSAPPPSPLVALHFCPRARVLAAAFADGRVCVAASQGGGGAGPADSLCLPRWVRGGGDAGAGLRRRRSSLGSLHDEDEPHTPPVTALAVSGEAGLLAVGLADGRTEIHPLAAPARSAALAAATRAASASAAAAAAAARAGAAPAAVSAAVAAAAAAAAADAAVAAQAPPLRVLSPLADEGGSGSATATRRPRRGTGSVASLAWSPCGSSLAVGWGGGGLCAWTSAGCRLFASAPPEAAAAAAAGNKADGLEAPASALAWSAGGTRLLIAQPGMESTARARLLELSLARGVPALRAGPIAALLADDRAFVLAAAAHGSPPTLRETRPPPSYIDANWPLRTASASPDGAHVAVAGRRGLCLLETGLGGGREASGTVAGRWRLFGDVAQERDLAVTSLAWLPGCVVVVAGGADARQAGSARGAPPASPQPPASASFTTARPDLRVYSRTRLDRDGLMASRRLARTPTALDAGGQHILAAFAPMDVLVLRYDARPAVTAPDGSVTRPAGGELVAVRELSILSSGPPVRGVALACMDGIGGWEGGGDRDATPPAHTAVLRYGGSLGLLDLATGGEAAVATGVEAAWLPPVGRKTDDDGSPVSPPWWVHGPAGGRMLLPDGGEVGGRPQQPESAAILPPDPELAFDGEVAPLLVTPGPGGAVVGVRQRAVRTSGSGGSGSSEPLFHLSPASQPTLSVLLRRLLATGRVGDAATVASAAASAPHFSAAMEWLVAAALLDHPPEAKSPSPLLTAATALARRFPAVYADTIVAVARKTDAAHWPTLFAAAGPPSDLLCDAAAAGALEGAACCLLVVDRVEGPAAAAGPALALLKSALEAGRYGLAAELLRFACPPPASGGCGLRPPKDGIQPVEEEPEAAAPAWCLVASHAWKQVAAVDVGGLRALGRALADDGVSLADALCCVPRPAVGGGGGGRGPAPRRMSGDTLVAVLRVAATAAGEDCAMLADATAAAGEADWAIACALVILAGGGGGGEPDARLAALVGEHRLLWADFVRVAQADSSGLPPGVRAVVDRFIGRPGK